MSDLTNRVAASRKGARARKRFLAANNLDRKLKDEVKKKAPETTGAPPLPQPSKPA